jgi:hypothetical protein
MDHGKASSMFITQRMGAGLTPVFAGLTYIIAIVQETGIEPSTKSGLTIC